MMNKMIFIIFVIMTTAVFGTTETKEVLKHNPNDASVQNINFIPGGGVVIENLREIKATVVDVDKESRVLTIVDADDVVTLFNATADVQNFNQISVGDTVVLSGSEGLVMLLAEPGQEIESSTTTILAKADPGEKPAVISVNVIEVTAEITKINSETRMVTVTGPKGNFFNLTVPEHVEGFSELSIGDKVNASYAQAFIVSVQIIEE